MLSLEAHSEHCQASKMEFFKEIISGMTLRIFCKKALS